MTVPSIARLDGVHAVNKFDDDPTALAKVGEIRHALMRISNSGVLGSGAKTQHLLGYLVEEELAGRGDRLQAFSVGVDALGKPQSFDPAKDSSVRVAMHSLRRSLTAYNSAATDQRVIIDLPKGSYRPVFTFADDDNAQAGAASKTGIFSQPRVRYVAAGLALALLLAVAMGWSIFRSADPADDCADARPALAIAGRTDGGTGTLVAMLEEYLAYYPAVQFVAGDNPPCAGAPQFTLQIAERAAENSPNAAVSLRLISDKTQAIRWSKTYGPMTNPFYPPAQLMAAQMAYDLGHGTGAVSAASADRRLWENLEARDRFICLVDAHRYFTIEDPEQRDGIRECMARYASDSRSADLLGLYAAITYSILHDSRDLKSVQRAELADSVISAIDRAGDYSPNDKELLIIKMRMARNERPVDLPGLSAVNQRMQRVLPMEPHILTQRALTQSRTFGNFEDGLRLIERATLIGGEYSVTILPKVDYLISTERWDEAADYLDRLMAYEYLPVYAIALCIAEKSGDAAAADKARQFLANEGLTDLPSIIEALGVRYAPSVQQSVADRCFGSGVST